MRTLLLIFAFLIGSSGFASDLWVHSKVFQPDRKFGGPGVGQFPCGGVYGAYEAFLPQNYQHYKPCFDDVATRILSAETIAATFATNERLDQTVIELNSAITNTLDGALKGMLADPTNRKIVEDIVRDIVRQELERQQNRP